MPPRRTVSSRRKPAQHTSDTPAKRRTFRSRRATRNAPIPTIDINIDLEAQPDDVEVQAEPLFAASVDPAPIEDSEPVRRIPRRTRPSSTPHQTRAAQNLIDAVGTSNAVEALRLSGKPKAARLADMLESSDYNGWSFYAKLDSIGLNLVEFTDLLLDVKQAKMVARLVMGGEEIAEQVLSHATDKFEPHAACRASGRVLLQDEDGEVVLTNDECFTCEGTGYVIKVAERENVELYLELVRLRKNQVMIDARKQVNNMTANVFGGGADLATVDGAPDVNSIIKRADEQMLIAPTRQVTDGTERTVDLVMPEDTVVEAEVVST